MSAILILLGANIEGRWGTPAQSLRTAIAELDRCGISLDRTSGLYRTRPVGGPRQPDYLNAVVRAKAKMPAARIMHTFKQLERRAGRRPAIGSRPRPLDLDILDFGGRRCGWPAAARRRGLVLPHPELHRRAFALVPLLEVAPHWCHPVLRLSGRALLGRLRQPGHSVRRVLDSRWILCDREPT
jgi:2-amino-4-hydroxy-6-hydroxymethyldihydropteridine diphosphokinase